MKSVFLNNDKAMPIIGLGTFRSESEDAYKAVLAALKAGYRHIDTASIYGNEEAVGRAIKDSGIAREKIFVTTKVWNSEQGYDSTIKSVNDSLTRLDMEYIDLVLIHWFKGYDKALSTYQALEEMYRNGKVKAIGASNYNIHHLQYLLANAEITPMVNQVETHIVLQNHFLHDFCKEHGIQMEAYAPLMSHHIKELLENETLQKIGKKYQKSVPQIAIRWLIEREIVVIPKSITPKRIIENFDVFDFSLTADDMKEIRKLNRGRKFFTEYDNVDY